MIPKIKTHIAIDASNLHYAVTRKGWKIDWEKFKSYLDQNWDIVNAYFYSGIESRNVYLSKNPGKTFNDFDDAKMKKKSFFRHLREEGYIVRHKPVTQLYDSSSGKYIRKCNFDVELTIDAIREKDSYENFILASGDGDFIPLLKYLKGCHKKVIVISDSGRLNKDLVKTANQTIYLKDIKSQLL